MLDPKEEAKFDELKSMCRGLHVPPPPEIMIGLQVHDKNGVLVFDDIQRGHSWTRNFWNFMFSIITNAPGTSSTFGAGYINAKETGGLILGSTTYTAMKGQALAGTGIVNNTASGGFGIVIGTSDTAFSVEHYTLQSLIAHGNGASQLYYQAMKDPTPSYTAGSKTWKNTLSRIYNNNSGGSITVKEVGLYSIVVGFGNAGYVDMHERSVLSPTVAVANGAQLTVTYEISMDFSAID